MGQVTLTGTWVAPDLTARSGRVVATLVDSTRADGGAIVGSAVGSLDETGTLPLSGPHALKITGPSAGTAVYTIRERLDDVTEHAYKITVGVGDTVIDLSARPAA